MKLVVNISIKLGETGRLENKKNPDLSYKMPYAFVKTICLCKKIKLFLATKNDNSRLKKLSSPIFSKKRGSLTHILTCK